MTGHSLTACLLAICLLSVGTATEAPAQTAAADSNLQRNRAARLYVRGLTQARDGNHQAAIDLFTEASRHAPKEAAIYLSLSEVHHALEQNDVALFYAEQAASVSKDAPYLHHLARSQLRAGEADLAAQTYDRLLQLATPGTDAVFEAARLKVHLGRDAEAAEAFERLIPMVGDDRILRTQLLQLYGRLEDIEGVERTLEALIRLQPSSEQYYLLLSDFYRKRDRLPDAIRILDTGLDNADDTYNITSELVTLYRREGQLHRADSLAGTLTDVAELSDDQLARRAEKAYLRATVDPQSIETAMALLTRALESSPGNAGLMIMLGDLHFSRGEYSDAAPLLARALEKEARNADLWVQTALAYLNAGELEEAARVADEAIILFPGRIEAHVVGGHAYMQLYRNELSIERFANALNLMEDDELWDRQLATESHAALGFLFSRRKDHESSDDHYRSAIRIDSTNSFALNNLAYSFAERKVNLEEAQSLAERALELDPDNASFLDTAGWIRFQLGDLEAAHELTSQAVETGGASATVHRHLGDIEKARGNSAAARSSWQRALELDPENEALKERLGQVSP